VKEDLDAYSSKRLNGLKIIVHSSPISCVNIVAQVHICANGVGNVRTSATCLAVEDTVH